MMEIQIKSGCIGQNLNDIGKQLDTVPVMQCDESVIHIPEKYGSGQIRGINFNSGLCLLDFKCQFYEKASFTVIDSKENPMRILFCTEGKLLHTVGTKGHTYEFEPFLSTMTSNPAGAKEHFIFPKNEIISFSSLEVNRKPFYDLIQCDLHTVSEELGNLLSDMESKEDFMYKSTYNLEVSRCLKEINNSTARGLLRKLFLEGKALHLLYLQLSFYGEDEQANFQRPKLKEGDLRAIRKARNLLLSAMSNPPTIPVLAKEVGINEQKLKVGFKKLFNKTINTFLLHARLARAKELIEEGELSIGQVSFEVGYTNKGYFARKFKDYYGLLPVDYLRKVIYEE